ncbi:hypothetical protein OG936_36435 [Streptomyces sp. NBC_00846]|uniref:hypothetical protein n=1 Tax=Streptomyces sp. NBC_00846 TaxID=2975849 RepID=UPI003869BCE8|nr:hypothetical protein OG936_36435 [Streptomyces sp. NBC_00846]
MRHQLGQQLDTLAAGDLTARVDELTQSNQQLTDQQLPRTPLCKNVSLLRKPISLLLAPACAG